MKNIFITLIAAITFIACSEDLPAPLPASNYTIEGKWLWSPDPNDRTYANTMYEYVDGIRYTYYPDCWPELCTDTHFYALDSLDRIPGFKIYTFDGDSITSDGVTNVVTFECDGGIWTSNNGGKLWRLSSNCQ